VLVAVVGEGAGVFVQGLGQFGGGETEVAGQSLVDRVERAVGGTGLGEAVGGQEQRRSCREVEPVDGRGLGGERGETEWDARWSARVW
jgi:hypothetical protein